MTEISPDPGEGASSSMSARCVRSKCLNIFFRIRYGAQLVSVPRAYLGVQTQNINDPEAGQKFQELGAAYVPACISSGSLTVRNSYETLSDPDMRHMYDVGGMEGLNGPGAGMGGMDPSELFAQFFQASGGSMPFGFDFGGAGPSRRRGKGEDTVIPHPVTLDELYNGKTLKLNLEKEAVCGTCKGYAFISFLDTRSNSRLVLVLAATRNLNPVACVKGKGGRPHKQVSVLDRFIRFVILRL